MQDIPAPRRTGRWPFRRGSPPPLAETLWRIRVTVPDTPGALARLTARLGRLRVNILALDVHPLAEGAVDELVIRAPADLAENTLVNALIEGGGGDVRVAPAAVSALADEPTRAVLLATWLAEDPDDLPRVLHQLLSGAELSWVEHEHTEALDGGSLRLRHPDGGTFLAERPGLAFTPAEFARARAMITLAHRLPPPPGRMVQLGERTAVLRRARPQDLDGLLDLHARCSPETLRRRYLGAPQTSRRALRTLVSRWSTHTLLALCDTEVVGTGSVFWDGDSAEVAFLVRDDWQNRGLGRELLRRLVDTAVAGQVRSICLHTYADNTAVLHLARLLGHPVRRSIADGVLTLELAPAAAVTR
ncbi:GNAT family N-acetyltransferase [Crossiella cryophila]|uniref:Ribosomal protein S18 acetylase RimI-like enzyme n=1 Tax=Crossiella cryophila TaxID=43355 RepID=A0A7W7CBM3_9PSEU|nr:GNAT family N-acetyltransferase [Crossiella cryophila]MBB4678002.1 ribosomal protein S18 acetylase RimI-like enzyme [Crossiella cryophila]